MKSKVVGTKKVKGWGKETTVPVLEEYQDGEKGERYTLDAALSDKMGLGASVAEQIGTNATSSWSNPWSRWRTNSTKSAPITRKAATKL
jgi:hypothetical protein